MPQVPTAQGGYRVAHKRVRGSSTGGTMALVRRRRNSRGLMPSMSAASRSVNRIRSFNTLALIRRRGAHAASALRPVRVCQRSMAAWA